MQAIRRDRSRSPMRVDSVGRRREAKPQDANKASDMSNVMNQMLINNMYSQGNMMSMYPNMMMSSAMLSGGMMPATGMEMMPSAGMEIVPQASVDMTAMSGQALGTTGATTMDMSLMGGMMMDPSIMGMYSTMGTDMSEIQDKKEIVLKYSKLSPPDPGTPQPPQRTRPPGCRTIFVGGLPDKIRESTVREIFENYGRIHTLRLSKKNFCHIRFERESSVDAAMAICGYRIKLINSKEKDKDCKEDDDDSHATSGWLHVDYALSRDDQNEYERRQRQVLRAQQAQMEQLNAQQQIATHNTPTSYRRSPSPVKIQPFSNAAIIQLSEKVKSEEQFAATLPTLLAWLERGECSKKNANQFYSMIQATNSHIRRLFNEKVQAEEELQECKERVKSHIENVIEQQAKMQSLRSDHTRKSFSDDGSPVLCRYLQTLSIFLKSRYAMWTFWSMFEQVAKVFVAASHQRVWDHFTKPQRKNIETWQKMTQEFNSLKEEFNEKFYNEDNDYNGYNNNKAIEGSTNEDVLQLKRENESLRFQLEAYKNEVDVIKSDAQKEMEKFKAQFIARQALQGAMDVKNPPLPAPVEKPPPPPPLPDDLDSKVHIKEVVDTGCGEAKLIGIMSAFLQVHPQGASLDYVVSYVRAMFSDVSQATVHHVLQKHNDVFRRTTSGVGANIEHRWLFVAFNNEKKNA